VDALDGVSNHQDTSSLKSLDEPLDRLANALGVPPLTSFYDYSELVSDYDDLLEDDAGSTAEAEWFDPNDALPTVEAIRAHLVDHPEALDVPQWFQAQRSRLWPQLMEDLQHVESELKRLATSGTRFRLLVVP
jgi:hypothetical protein